MKHRANDSDKLPWIAFLIGIAALMAAATIPGVLAAADLKQEPVEPLFVDPAECAEVQSSLQNLQRLWDEALALGDPVHQLALRLEAGEALSGQEKASMYDATERLDTALESVTTGIQELDARIPADPAPTEQPPRIHLTMAHLKAGIAVEPIRVFRSRTVSVLMAALLACDIDSPDLLDCQAQKILLAYVSPAGTGRFGETYERKDLYAKLKQSGSPALTSYLDFISARTCPQVKSPAE